MHDALDIEPIDADVMEEIRLIANLMIAAATVTDRLSTRSIDLALGIGSSKPCTQPKSDGWPGVRTAG